MTNSNRIASILHGLVVTAPTWFGLLSGASQEDIVPVQSVVVLLVAAGYLIQRQLPTAEEALVAVRRDTLRRETRRHHDD